MAEKPDDGAWFWDQLHLSPKQLLIAYGCAVAFIVVVALSSEGDPRKIGGFSNFDWKDNHVLVPYEFTEISLRKEQWSKPICNLLRRTHEFGWQLDKKYVYLTLNSEGEIKIGSFTNDQLHWKDTNYQTNADRPPKSCFRLTPDPELPIDEQLVKVTLLEKE